MSAREEEELLRAVALQNVQTILLARKRAEEELVQAEEQLRASRERLQAAPWRVWRADRVRRAEPRARRSARPTAG